MLSSLGHRNYRELLQVHTSAEIDRRFLAFVNRNQPDANNPSPRPLPYNERILQKGAALPYFIWPNIDPFRDVSLLDAVISPGMANRVAEATPALRRAREFVRRALVLRAGGADGRGRRA